jgi:hypothetical protein
VSGTLVPPTVERDDSDDDRCDHGKKFWNCSVCAENPREQHTDPSGNKRKK